MTLSSSAPDAAINIYSPGDPSVGILSTSAYFWFDDDWLQKQASQDPDFLEALRDVVAIFLDDRFTQVFPGECDDNKETNDPDE